MPWPPCLLGAAHAMPSRKHHGDVLQLRTDQWRVPFVMCLAAVLLFTLTVTVDREAARGWTHLPGWLFVGGPDDARAILGAMLGAVSTVLALKSDRADVEAAYRRAGEAFGR
jgi:uncharacterized membrane protein